MGKDKKPQPSKKDSKDDKGGKAAGGKKGKNDNAEDSGKATKLKGAQSINVRHILVCTYRSIPSHQHLQPTPTPYFTSYLLGISFCA